MKSKNKSAKVVDLKKKKLQPDNNQKLVDTKLKKNIQEIYFDTLRSIDDMLTEGNSESSE